MIFNIPLLLGSTGMLLVLTAFVLNQIHKLNEDSRIYDLMNLVGSGLLVAYALLIDGYPFFVLNGIWCLVSLRDLLTGKKLSG